MRVEQVRRLVRPTTHSADATRVVQVTASIVQTDGGPTTGALGLNAAYNRRGNTTSVVLATEAEGLRGRLSAAERGRLLANPEIDLHLFPRSRPFRFKNSWPQRRAIRRAATSADLVHIHGLYLAHTAWAYQAARANGVPYVVQPHGALEPYQAAKGRLRKFAWNTFIGERILRNATALVAASQAEAENLRRTMPDVPVIVMPLGVNKGLATVHEQILGPLQPWLSQPRHRRVLFLGRLARKKRPDLLVHAWNELAIGRLAVVGPDGEWTAAELRTMVAPQRHDDVVFPGGVAPTTARWLMQNAGIFVLPSENENFAIVVGEAMAAGCAILTTAQTAASEHVALAGAGVILDHPTSASLAPALADMLSDPDRVEEYGRRGQAYARQHLTWDSAVDTLLNSHVLGGPRASSPPSVPAPPVRLEPAPRPPYRS